MPSIQASSNSLSRSIEMSSKDDIAPFNEVRAAHGSGQVPNPILQKSQQHQPRLANSMSSKQRERASTYIASTATNFNNQPKIVIPAASQQK